MKVTSVTCKIQVKHVNLNPWLMVNITKLKFLLLSKLLVCCELQIAVTILAVVVVTSQEERKSCGIAIMLQLSETLVSAESVNTEEINTRHTESCICNRSYFIKQVINGDIQLESVTKPTLKTTTKQKHVQN